MNIGNAHGFGVAGQGAPEKSQEGGVCQAQCARRNAVSPGWQGTPLAEGDCGKEGSEKLGVATSIAEKGTPEA